MTEYEYTKNSKESSLINVTIQVILDQEFKDILNDVQLILCDWSFSILMPKGMKARMRIIQERAKQDRKRAKMLKNIQGVGKYFTVFERALFYDHRTHERPILCHDTPWKYQKTSIFLMFSGDIERGQ